MPWVKGQSGNPGGRPKEEVDIRKLARSRGKQAIDALYEIMCDEKAPPAARIADRWRCLIVVMAGLSSGSRAR